MKFYLPLMFLSICIFYFTRCNLIGATGSREKIEYILIIDKLDTSEANDLINKFNDQLNNFDEDAKQLTVSIICTSDKSSIQTSTESDGITGVKNLIRTKISEQIGKNIIGGNLLHCIEKALNKLTEMSTKYTILFYSSMLERSGDPNGEGNSWENGRFHFLENGYACASNALNAAIKQIDSSQGWIYNHLIEKGSSNQLTNDVNLVFPNVNGIEVQNTGHGSCDNSSIDLFWKKLFAKIGFVNIVNVDIYSIRERIKF
jgi:hypothetical protein